MIARNESMDAAARSAGILSVLIVLAIPAPAAASAVGSLRSGETVEVTGAWDPGTGFFVASRIEKLREGRRAGARGTIAALDPRAAAFSLYGRTVRVDEATVFVTAAGVAGGTLGDLRPGVRVDINADPDSTGDWRAKKVEWGEVKASDKVKGRITEVDQSADSTQTIWISGLGVRLTDQTDLKTDYLEEELLGTLFSDEGDANLPHLRFGPLRLAGYVRMTTYRDDGYTLSAAADDSLVGQPAVALQLAGDWAAAFQTLVDFRMGSDQSWVDNRFDVDSARFELLQAYAVLRTPRPRGVMLMVGKQRMRDQREWLFDEYLDAARVYLTLTRPVVLEASYLPSLFPPQGEKFQTWDDLLLRARFIPDSRNEVNVYWLRRWDSSTRRRQPIYIGLSGTGRPARWLRGWAEGALLRGEDKGRPQRGYAFDVGTTLSTTGRVRPSLTLGYALGSGEQKRAGGGFSSFKYYGEVLDPELANIQVMTVAVGLRLGYRVSADVVGHIYRQQVPDDDLEAALPLDGAPDGDSPDLGREADFILGIQNILGRASVAYGAGVFEPGVALRTTDRLAVRHRVSVRIGF
jgi:hypothetical protein